nr:acyl-CoA thioesterase domain-containing protein [Hyphomonas sp. Mor2]
MGADTIMNLLRLKAESNETWSIGVDRRLCLGPPDAKHLSGGACSAILVDALEQVTGKPLIQASAHFFKAPKVDDIVTVSLDHHRPGRSIDMATAVMTYAAEPHVRLSGSFGTRHNMGDYQWTPDVEFTPPEKSAEIPFARADPGDLHTTLDMRLAAAPRNGRLVFWVRTPSQPMAAPARFLALIADYLPEAIHLSIGRPVGAMSLDNSLRVVGNQLTEWTLCVTQLEAIQRGIFHGRMTLLSERGELLATASQSGVVTLLEA